MAMTNVYGLSFEAYVRRGGHAASVKDWHFTFRAKIYL